MNSRSKLKCYSAVCSNREREKKTRQNRAFATHTHRENDVLMYKVFVPWACTRASRPRSGSTWDTWWWWCKKKTTNFSRAESVVRKLCAKKVGCQMRHIFFNFLFVCCEKSMCFVELHKMFTTTTQRIRRTRKGWCFYCDQQKMRDARCCVLCAFDVARWARLQNRYHHTRRSSFSTSLWNCTEIVYDWRII